MKTVLGIVGGSGLYDLEGLVDATWKRVATPWGEPSDAILHARHGDLDLRFLPRHGRGHRLAPTDINYRANIDALKRSGVTDLVSVSSCGSFREHLAPGTFVLVDQFIDRTRRASSFFGEGLVAHVSMADPVSPGLVDLVEKALLGTDISFVKGGTYLAMEGPQFSTRAESHLYRSWGCDVIGMTNMPEAKLAREAELRYCTVAMVTDYDCWHDEHDDVEVSAILETIRKNTTAARGMLKLLMERMPATSRPCPVGSDRCLDTAIITAKSARSADRLSKLDAILGRFLRAEGSV